MAKAKMKQVCLVCGQPSGHWRHRPNVPGGHYVVPVHAEQSDFHSFQERYSEARMTANDERFNDAEQRRQTEHWKREAEQAQSVIDTYSERNVVLLNKLREVVQWFAEWNVEIGPAEQALLDSVTAVIQGDTYSASARRKLWARNQRRS